MAYHHTASAAMPAQPQPNQNAARTQRVNQVQFIEERLRNGISPAAVTGITALLAQLETQPTLPSLAVSIVADVAGYKRTMTCRNGVWDGYDQTHTFLDDRSTTVKGPSVQTTLEQEATLRVPLANVPMTQPLNPAHLVIQAQSLHPQSGTHPPMYLQSAQTATPSATQVAPHASAPAAHAPHMVLSATPRLESEAGSSSPMSSARVQSVKSSAPPSMRSGVTAPDMSHRTPSEQAVIQALQAVAKYPESRDFVETVWRQMPGLQNLLGSRGQQEGCLTTREGQGPSTDPLTPSAGATRNRAPSPIPGLSPVSDEELGRKRASPHELAQGIGNNDSPTSRPPPDKRNNVLRSVVIQEPPKLGYHGISEPQMTMKEVMERYAQGPASMPESTDNSVHSSSSTAKSGKKFTGPPYFPQSDNVSGSVVTRDANRIWQVAPKLNDRQYRDRQKVPPTNTHQAQLRKLSVIVYVTRTLRPFGADTGEAAWKQRVIRRLTTTHDIYLRPMQNNLHEQCNADICCDPVKPGKPTANTLEA